VDEAEPDAAVIAAQQPVSRVESLGKRGDAIDERLLTVAVMVQMHLDVRDAHGRQSRQQVDRGRVVLLLGIEKGVTGRLSHGVGVPACESRPAPRPPLNAFERRSLAGAPPPWLEMIGNRQPDSRHGRARVNDVMQPSSRVSRQPQTKRAQGR
jgi:hypothetical protein